MLRSAFTLVTMIAISFTYAQTGPGGVGNSTTNKIWLKAGEGVLSAEPNSPVELWMDQSGNGFHAQQSLQGNRPRYQNNGLNGRPFIHFNRSLGTQYFELTSSGIVALMSNSNTIFAIAKVNSGGADNSTNAYQSIITVPGYHSAVGFTGYPEANNAFLFNYVGGAVPGGSHPPAALNSSGPIQQQTWNLITRRVTENSGGTSQNGFINGVSTGTPTSSTLQMTNYNSDLARIGAAHTSGTYTWALNGDISELIVYNVSLNDAQRILVENYLASKYNLSISNDRFSYDAPSQFPHQVAGVGSQNVIDTHLSANVGILNISSTAIPETAYALAGHNGQPIAFLNSSALAGMKRLERVWRFDVTGDPGLLNISFTINQFSASVAQDFKLLVSTDGDFSDATPYSGTVANGLFTLNAPISVPDGAFVTLGYNDIGTTSPVSLNYEPNRIILRYGDVYTSSLPAISDGGAQPSYSLINPPAGITIHPSTGQLSVNSNAATTAQTGTHALTVNVNNSEGSTLFSSAYTCIVIPYGITSLYYPQRTVTMGNNIEPAYPNLPANAFSYSVASGSLNGLTLDNNTGIITGILQSEGTISAVIQATPTTANTTGGQVSTMINFSAVGFAGPAGIGSSVSNKIWLDASSQSGLTNGALVSNFSDRSGNGWHAIQPTLGKRPAYLQNQLNGKAVVRFDRTNGTKYLELSYTGIGNTFSNSNTAFIVGKSNTGAYDNSTNVLQALLAIPGYHSTMAFNGFPTSNKVTFYNYVGSSVPGTPVPTNIVSSNLAISENTWQLLTRRITENGYGTSQTGFVNGATMGPPSIKPLQMTNYTANIVRVGAANVTSDYHIWPLNGDIAEIIVFNTTLNEAQRLITENYLSAKYSLSIAGDKYTLNDPGYILDVEGIGTTDGTVSNKHSTASNSKGLKLTEMNFSLDADSEFLLAGHASASNGLVTLDIPASVQQRWQRIWYLEKSGSIDAKLSFDISDAGLIVPANLANEFSYYQLLYKASPTGPFTAIPLIPTLENNDQLSFTLNNSQLVNGYYTLGYSQGIMWTGAVNEDWNQAANWSLNRIPSSTDHVIVNLCTTCPRLSNAVDVGSLQLNAGSKIVLGNHTLAVLAISYLNETTIESEQGKLSSVDFSELKSSTFKGAVILEKTGGAENTSYGGNTEVKIINSSSSAWQISGQSNNLIKKL